MNRHSTEEQPEVPSNAEEIQHLIKVFTLLLVPGLLPSMSKPRDVGVSSLSPFVTLDKNSITCFLLMSYLMQTQMSYNIGVMSHRIVD